MDAGGSYLPISRKLLNRHGRVNASLQTSPRPFITVKQVISCSRRTDIPAHYLTWLIERLKEGHVQVTNPYSGKVMDVSLAPEHVMAIVLWSKDFGPFKDSYPANRALWDRYDLHFHFTLNHAPRLEPNVPPMRDRLDQAKWLIDTFGVERLNWRFDPIVFWEEEGVPTDNLGRFPLLLQQMSQWGVRICTFSFAHWYGKCIGRAKKAGFRFIDPDEEEKKAIASGLVKEARRHEITLMACCNPYLDCVEGIERASCIDGNRIRGAGRYAMMDDSRYPRRPTRDGCGCRESIDIGSYTDHPCPHNCVYCYANPAPIPPPLDPWTYWYSGWLTPNFRGSQMAPVNRI